MKAQVRTWAMRAESASMSPSVRSTSAIWRANQSSGTRPARTIKPNMVERQIGVSGRRSLAIIGNLAHVPQPRDVGAGLGVAPNFFVARERFQRDLVLGGRRARQSGQRRRLRRARRSTLRSMKNPERRCAIATARPDRRRGIRSSPPVPRRRAGSGRWCRKSRRGCGGRRVRRSGRIRPGSAGGADSRRICGRRRRRHGRRRD